ncbi:uncharacterized protein LOC131957757 [Physella acuta]|uniref:uncharacterized protein LOC131957757 n=1 Tax=Physella acuta TaxID=109671 RepID=UPI0027DC247F|nr:uncharacterized protein LOC131957757 [Physella acuta]XP_059178504.1 uncharacterized protein LOC131957757 [Physella acuta]
MSKELRPIVMSGPSGSGKSTLLEKLFAEFPGCFAFSVSHTTRSPRPGEKDGVAYFFVKREEFEKLKAENGFLENAEFSGNLYGTSKKSVNDIMKSGKLCVLDVEVNGVKNIKKSDFKPKPRYIFVKPPSIEELRKRLDHRNTETKESLEKRISAAKEAFEYAEQDGAYDHIIVNNDLEVAYKELKDILQSDIKLVQDTLHHKGK